MYNSAKSTNTENLIGNIIESSIFIDSTNNDVESLKLKVNDPYFETKYSVFQSQGKTTEIDLKNPSPEQVAKLELILELIQDKKLTEEQIKNSLKLIDTKPWMSGSEVKQLKPSDWILWNNIIQSGLTAPAIITTLIRCGCPYGILTNIAGFVVSGGGYMFLQNKSHELETNLYSGDSKSRIEDFRNRALQVVATGLISIIPSYVGGQNVNSVFFSPHQKIERIIVSDKNIEISTKKAQTIIDANKKELENDSSYKAILARVKQAESKIAQNNTELRDFDDKHKDDPKSDNVKLEKVRIKGLESAKSVLAGRTQRQFASNGILVDNQDFIELDKANQALAEYENSTTAGEQNSEYRKSKEKLNLLAKLRNEKENAWKQDDSEKLINEQVLRILAEDQGKSPEHLKELINGTLSTQEMDQLAEPYFTNKENGFTDNLAHLVILLDLIILGSRLYSLNKKQLVSNEDYQKGLEELGQNYGSKLSSLKFQRDIYDGEEIPEDPMDRSQDQKDLASSNGNKELILNKILNSREFLLAVQIVAAEGYGTLGVAMKEFQAEFKLSMNVKSVIGNQVNRFSSIKSAISSIANYPSTIFQKIQDSNLEKSEQKSAKQKNEFLRNFKLGTNKIIITKNLEQAVEALGELVNRVEEINDFELDDLFVSQEIDPINSILSIESELTKLKIDKSIVHKVLIELVKYSSKNKGMDYTLDNIIPIITNTRITQKDLNEIDQKINHPAIEQVEVEPKVKQFELLKNIEDTLSKVLAQLNQAELLIDFDIHNNEINGTILNLYSTINSSVVKSTVVNYYKNNLNHYLKLNHERIFTDASSWILASKSLLELVIECSQNKDSVKNNGYFKSILASSNQQKEDERLRISNLLLTKNRVEDPEDNSLI